MSRFHRAAVLDPDVRVRRTEPVAQPLADHRVDFLGEFGRGGLAGADRPDRLVGDHDVRRAVHRHEREALLDLRADDRKRLAGLALLVGFAAADDRSNAGVEQRFGLPGHECVVFTEECAALAVADDRVAAAQFDQHRWRDLARERALGLGFTFCDANATSLPARASPSAASAVKGGAITASAAASFTRGRKSAANARVSARFLCIFQFAARMGRLIAAPVPERRAGRAPGRTPARRHRPSKDG